MVKVRWKLSEVLSREGLTAARLSRAMGVTGKVGWHLRNLTEPPALKRGGWERLLRGLKKLGIKVNPQDLIEFVYEDKDEA
jgi:hypothetical protein